MSLNWAINEFQLSSVFERFDIDNSNFDMCYTSFQQYVFSSLSEIGKAGWLRVNRLWLKRLRLTFQKKKKKKSQLQLADWFKNSEVKC